LICYKFLSTLPIIAGELIFGSFLVNKSVEYAKNWREKQLYLFTEHSSDLYKKLGWIPLEEITYRGYPATIMKIDIT